MRMVTAEEFFDYLVQKYGDKFPETTGDAAGHWELVKLRVPEAAAKMRAVSNMLPVAEAAAAISSLLTKRTYPQFDLFEAWYSLLSFHEHTADAGGGWPGYFSRADADWSNTAHYSAALNGFSNTEQMLRRSILRIAVPDQEHMRVNPVPAATDSATVVVYNGLAWSRGGPVTVDRLPSSLREGSLVVEDLTTGEQASYEDVPGSKRQILIFAKQVPGVGYKAYRIRKGESVGQVAPQPFPIGVSWNSSGWITSLSQGEHRIEAADSAKPIGRLLAVPRPGGFPGGRDRAGPHSCAGRTCKPSRRDGPHGLGFTPDGDHDLSRCELCGSAVRCRSRGRCTRSDGYQLPVRDITAVSFGQDFHRRRGARGAGSGGRITGRQSAPVHAGPVCPLRADGRVGGLRSLTSMRQCCDPMDRSWLPLRTSQARLATKA